MTSGSTPTVGEDGPLPHDERLPGYSRHSECRFCASPDLIPFLDFGKVPLAGGFLRKEQAESEVLYPLTMQFCPRCTLVQAGDVVSVDELFHNYFYFSSAIGTLRNHFADLAREVRERWVGSEDPLVVEIGCNDGVFLRPLKAEGIRGVGVDPATNVVESVAGEGLDIVNDCFTERVAEEIRECWGRADAVVSSYSFAHIDDVVDVMNGVKAVLEPGGVFIVEVYYLGILLDEMQYDMMYHEHMSYYSLTALQRFLTGFGMEVFDVTRIPLRAGTLRFYCRNTGQGALPVTEAVTDLLEQERESGLHCVETYVDFGRRVEESRVELLRLVDGIKAQGKRIIGYGASGRGTMIMNFCGIDGRYLDYVVDDAPAKHGFLTPGTHLPIRPWSAAEDDLPDYALLFAWSFADEVMRRRADYLQAGGRFVVPLPTPTVRPE